MLNIKTFNMSTFGRTSHPFVAENGQGFDKQSEIRNPRVDCDFVLFLYTRITNPLDVV